MENENFTPIAPEGKFRVVARSSSAYDNWNIVIDDCDTVEQAFKLADQSAISTEYVGADIWVYNDKGKFRGRGASSYSYDDNGNFIGHREISK